MSSVNTFSFVYTSQHIYMLLYSIAAMKTTSSLWINNWNLSWMDINIKICEQFNYELLSTLLKWTCVLQ